EIAQGGRIGELRRHSRVDGPPGQEHEPEVPERVQQKDGKQNVARRELSESREKVQSRGDVEDHRRGYEIEREDPVEDWLQRLPLMVAPSASPFTRRGEGSESRVARRVSPWPSRGRWPAPTSRGRLDPSGSGHRGRSRSCGRHARSEHTSATA